MISAAGAPVPFASQDAWVRSLLLAAWRQQVAEGRYRGDDPFRRLRVDADRAAEIVATAPDLGTGRAVSPPPPNGDGWCEVARRLGLDAVEHTIVTVAVAVEIDARLRPLVAALQDDAGLRHPTVDLLDELVALLDAAPTLLAARRALAPDARLARLDLVRLHAEDGRPSLGERVVVVDEWLLGVAVDADHESTGITPVARVAPVGEGHRTPGPTLVAGADPVARQAAFGAWMEVDDLAVVDLRDVSGGLDDEEGRLRAGARRALVADAALLVQMDGVTSTRAAELEALAALGVAVGVSVDGRVGASPPGWGQLTVPPPTRDQRRAAWCAALERGRPRLCGREITAVDGVAANASVGLDAIETAARRVTDLVAPGTPVDGRVLQRAVRQTAWADLSAVARYVENRHGWSDLVVADHTRRQLDEIVGAIHHLATVVDEWGFGDRPGGLGLHLLFAGPSGTGKTLAASVIASECDLDLWVVDLARVVDKYLGETEKQLDRVLTAAERCGAMLLFDEADALFGRRGEVREAKDRWANVEVAYLLQRIEQHRGVTVLTTNLGQNLDVAFARRMGHRVDFAMPDGELRRELWRRSVPARAPVADEAAFGVVADRFELAGGAIRNAALNAAFAAAQDGRPIELDHLVLATVRELVKVGKAPTRSELVDLPGVGDLVPGRRG